MAAAAGKMGDINLVAPKSEELTAILRKYLNLNN